VRWRGAVVHVLVTHEQATYLAEAGSVDLELGGELITLAEGDVVRRPLVPRVPLLPPPRQPPGREARRHNGTP